MSYCPDSSWNIIKSSSSPISVIGNICVGKKPNKKHLKGRGLTLAPGLTGRYGRTHRGWNVQLEHLTSEKRETKSREC